MRRKTWVSGLGALVAIGAVLMLLTTFASAASSGGAAHVRWDIVSTSGIPPGPLNPGGHASATAPDGDTITLMGSGTFVAPASGGGSDAVTGGGTWSTTANGGASGTYTVTGLVSWESAGAQACCPFIDNIDEGTRTNGTAVVTIAFSDGAQGVLTIGCHGPGAPPGIFEGIATMKSYKTYYTVQPPSAGVDANRTIFHVR